jgi:hypothetical protein
MKNREPQSAGQATARPPRTVRVRKQINWRVKYERSLARTAEREAHLRSLMGLPAVRSALTDDEAGA